MKLKAFLRKTTGGKHTDHRYFWWHSAPVLPCANLRCVHPSLCDTRELFSSGHGQNRHTICFLRHILKFWTLWYFFQVWLKNDWSYYLNLYTKKWTCIIIEVYYVHLFFLEEEWNKMKQIQGSNFFASGLQCEYKIVHRYGFWTCCLGNLSFYTFKAW